MEQRIIGFHQDPEGVWAADLACGHHQHVRHEPPWQVRPWLTTVEGRASRLGESLQCRACDEWPAHNEASAASRVVSSTLWRRLDAAGHDAAQLEQGPAGVELRGMAVFHDVDGPAALAYHVHCNHRWLTTAARISGWRNAQPITLEIARDDDGQWQLNGSPCPTVGGCSDIDLNFTPATNLLPLRRLPLALGESIDIRSAWLQWPSASLLPLVQRYHRKSSTEYEYEAELPEGELFQCTLEVDAFGWVRAYGGLWRTEVSTISLR